VTARTIYTGLYAIEPPEYLKAVMLARGGRNPYGEPNYRLVRAEARKRWSGGEWFEWLHGTAMRDRKPGINRAFKSVIETRPIPMYPGEHGWVLEMWLGPERYGTPEQWYLPEASGGTVRIIGGELVLGCGVYPGRGDYEGTGYIFPDGALSEALVANAIGRIERFRDGLPPDPAQRIIQERIAAEEEQARLEAEADRQTEEILGEGTVLDAWSPGGQAEVCRLAEKIGIRAHPF
jgi:hypothetical protein